MSEIPRELISKLHPSATVVVLTGAGISAESGLPTFRGAGGWWRTYRAEDLATPQAFARDPVLIWQWYCHRRELVNSHQPNPGHHALVDLSRHVGELQLITQCVDGYHQQAGSEQVTELHGSLLHSRCQQCGHTGGPDSETWREGLPYCQCGGLRRPAVAWFGEALPAAALEHAFRAAEKCEVFFSIGTSALVHPAAQLPMVAKDRGAYIVEINPEETPLTRLVDASIHGPAGQVLPRLIDELEEDSP